MVHLVAAAPVNGLVSSADEDEGHGYGGLRFVYLFFVAHRLQVIEQALALDLVEEVLRIVCVVGLAWVQSPHFANEGFTVQVEALNGEV